eukprot:CAMPEP_0118670846 /NCGR_PEP_ID=MMETSP0785-20121206/21681_1 /TAXON_ID=91992 /ORGANISM="Bolidomonas pacifica, Strain CCMP 1866" /LENGTH=81 /DNA_ID=CAMNT_0006565681 /DNA_START=340 /DNA_END=585 /DNA_ORIENTATION=+
MKPSVEVPDLTFSLVWCTSCGPNARRALKPMSGSPITAGPSWSTSCVPGVTIVKQSSVGATPAVWTERPRTWFMKVDLPDE